MKIVLHGGTYKTGSTSIQNLAWQNSYYLLNEFGLLYPASGINTQNSAVGCRHASLVYGYGKSGYDEILKDMDKEIREKDPNTLLISSEAWAVPGAHESLQHLVSHFRKKGVKDITGVFYLRDIHDYMLKHYMEWVRRYQVKIDANTYVMKRRSFFDYLSIMRKNNDALKGNMQVYNYSTAGNITQHFFQMLGIDAKLLSTENIEKNISLSPVDIELQRIANRYQLTGLPHPPAEDLLEKAGLSLSQGDFGYTINENIFSPYTSQYAKKLAEVTGIPVKEIKKILTYKSCTGTDVENTIPVLETLYLDWLKNR